MYISTFTGNFVQYDLTFDSSESFQAFKSCWSCTEEMSMDKITPSNTLREKVAVFSQAQKEPITDIKQEIEVIEEIPINPVCSKSSLSIPTNNFDTLKRIEKNKRLVCLNCQRFGHKALHCPDMICKECGIKGHGRITCPRLVHSLPKLSGIKLAPTKTNTKAQNDKLNNETVEANNIIDGEYSPCPPNQHNEDPKTKTVLSENNLKCVSNNTSSCQTLENFNQITNDDPKHAAEPKKKSLPPKVRERIKEKLNRITSKELYDPVGHVIPQNSTNIDYQKTILPGQSDSLSPGNLFSKSLIHSSNRKADIILSEMPEVEDNHVMKQNPSMFLVSEEINSNNLPKFGDVLDSEVSDNLESEIRHSVPMEPPPPPNISVTKFLKTENVEPIQNNFPVFLEQQTEGYHTTKVLDSVAIRKDKNQQNIRYIGNIRWLDQTHSQGVIEYNDKDTIKYCHVSSKEVYGDICDNDEVSFEIVPDKKFGKTAKNVCTNSKVSVNEKQKESANQQSDNNFVQLSSDNDDDDEANAEMDAINKILNNKKLKRKLLHALLQGKKEKQTKKSYESKICNQNDSTRNRSRSTDRESRSESDDEIALLDCSCKEEPLSLCQRCPAYFLEAFEEVKSIKFDETEVVLARILEYTGSGRRVAKFNLSYVRQIPLIEPKTKYQSQRFQLIEKLGKKSLITCIRPVMCESYAFVSVRNCLQNSTKVNINKGDILGACQELSNDFIKKLIGTKFYLSVLNDSLKYESRLYSTSDHLIKPEQQILIKTILREPLPKDKNMYVSFKWPAVGLRIESGFRCLQYDEKNNENYVIIKVRNVTQKAYSIKKNNNIGIIQNLMNNTYCQKAINKNNQQKGIDKIDKKKKVENVKSKLRSKSCEKEVSKHRKDGGIITQKINSVTSNQTKPVEENEKNERSSSSMPKIDDKSPESRKKSCSKGEEKSPKTNSSQGPSRESSIDDAQIDLDLGKNFATGSVENIEEMLATVSTKIDEHCETASLQPKEIKSDIKMKRDGKNCSNVIQKGSNTHFNTNEKETEDNTNESQNTDVIKKNRRLASIENVFVANDMVEVSLMCELQNINLEGYPNMFSVKIRNLYKKNFSYERTGLPILNDGFVMLNLTCKLTAPIKIGKGEEIGLCDIVEDFDQKEKLEMSEVFELKTKGDYTIGSYKKAEVECEFSSKTDLELDTEVFTRSLRKLKTIKVIKSRTKIHVCPDSKKGHLTATLQNTSYGQVNLKGGYVVGEAVQIRPFIPDENDIEVVTGRQKGKRVRKSNSISEPNGTTLLTHEAKVLKNYVILPNETRHVVLKAKFDTSIIIYSTAIKQIALLSLKKASVVLHYKEKHLLCLSKTATEYFFTVQLKNIGASTIEIERENDVFNFELTHKQIFDFGKIVHFGEFNLSQSAIFEAFNLNNEFFWPMSVKNLQCRVLGELSCPSKDVIIPKNNQGFKRKSVLVVKKKETLPELVLNLFENAGAYGHILDNKNTHICLKNSSMEKVYVQSDELAFLVIMKCEISAERKKEIKFIQDEIKSIL